MAFRPVRVSGLELHLARRGAAAQITVVGELDAHNSRSLELLGVEALEVPDLRVVVLDCSAVTHVSSDGLGALLELSRLADSLAVRFEVERPSRLLHRLLDLAGLHRLLSAGARPSGFADAGGG